MKLSAQGKLGEYDQGESSEKGLWGTSLMEMNEGRQDDSVEDIRDHCFLNTFENVWNIYVPLEWEILLKAQQR